MGIRIYNALGRFTIVSLDLTIRSRSYGPLYLGHVSISLSPIPLIHFLPPRPPALPRLIPGIMRQPPKGVIYPAVLLGFVSTLGWQPVATPFDTLPDTSDDTPAYTPLAEPVHGHCKPFSLGCALRTGGGTS